MPGLFLAPHNDDETLFGAFTILRHRPHVVVCLRSHLQAQRGHQITDMARQTETARALWWLGDPTWEQWKHSDANPVWGDVEESMRYYDERRSPEIVWAPQPERDGHDHHNTVGELAGLVFGDRVRHYMTYERGYGKSKGDEVHYEPSWPAKKLRAMSCYDTQIALKSTEFWFMDASLREYMA